jgi:hypothetical protein
VRRHDRRNLVERGACVAAQDAVVHAIADAYLSQIK